MNEMLFICICLLKVELLQNHFLNHCSYIIVPHWVDHLLLFISIYEKCESTCSLMSLILNLHFHAKSILYFSNWRYKLVTFWMIIQWTQVIDTKKACVLEQPTQLSSFWKKNCIEFWLFFLLIAFPGRLLYIA